MKMLGWVAMAFIAGCGQDTCEINVATMSDIVAGHVTLTGEFSSAQPLLDLRKDGMDHIVACVVAPGSTTADCNVGQSGISPGPTPWRSG
ncbi:MAG: hypothetical protein IPQ07_41160 [Myxococcales bacterium]|nr:hypothetical protein [Myxococcales bacterium]